MTPPNHRLLLERIRSEQPPKNQSAHNAETEYLFEKHRSQHEVTIREMERGWLGKFFGMGGSTGINIAGLVCVLTFLLLALSLFIEIKGDVSTVRAALIGLIASALSYIFGASKH